MKVDTLDEVDLAVAWLCILCADMIWLGHSHLWLKSWDLASMNWN